MTINSQRAVEVLRTMREDGGSVSEDDYIAAIDHAIATIERERWRPIAEAPKDGKRAFVVIGVGVEGYASGPYTTDPYCVLAQDGWWARWPHPFPPTHWRPLPDPQPDGQEG